MKTITTRLSPARLVEAARQAVTAAETRVEEARQKYEEAKAYLDREFPGVLEYLETIRTEDEARRDFVPVNRQNVITGLNAPLLELLPNEESVAQSIVRLMASDTERRKAQAFMDQFHQGVLPYRRQWNDAKAALWQANGALRAAESNARQAQRSGGAFGNQRR